MRSTESDPKKALISLKRDLQNGDLQNGLVLAFTMTAALTFVRQHKTSYSTRQALIRNNILTQSTSQPSTSSEDNDDVLDGEFRPTE